MKVLSRVQREYEQAISVGAASNTLPRNAFSALEQEKLASMLQASTAAAAARAEREKRVCDSPGEAGGVAPPQPGHEDGVANGEDNHQPGLGEVTGSLSGDLPPQPGPENDSPLAQVKLVEQLVGKFEVAAK